MLPEGVTYKFVAASVVLTLALAIALLKWLWGLVERARLRWTQLPAQPAPRAEVAPPAPREPEVAVDTAPARPSFGRRRTLANPGEARAARGPAPAVSARAQAEMDAAVSLLQAIAEQGLPLPAHEGPLPEAIEAARWRPIVFRQFLPEGSGKDGLSFYGGQPIGPADFQWPRRHGSEGAPLTFLMQWDCAQLAGIDATGLLPKDGVLYCFVDLAYGVIGDGGKTHAFLHHPGPTEGWAQIPVPADAPPIFGEDGPHQAAGCTPRIDNAADYVPRTMPRFPFAPVAFDYPRPDRFDEEDGDRLYWSEKLTAEALLAIAKQGRPEEPVGELPAANLRFERPFAAFPHDFAAIRVLAAAVIKELDRQRFGHRASALSAMTEEERTALIATCRDEALELYRLGCQRPMGTPLDAGIADDIWQWLEHRQAFVPAGIEGIALEAVELSLGAGSGGLERVPAEWIEKAMRRHDLADEYTTAEYFHEGDYGDRESYYKRLAAGEIPQVRRLHAPTPAHMLGPPSYVQGDVEELIDDHLLLLELAGGSGPGHSFGEGVLQYLIRPEDLAAGRFDKVVSVLSGY